MPYITVESGTLSDKQKELPDKNFGIGGKTIDKVKAEYMQAHQS